VRLNQVAQDFIQVLLTPKDGDDTSSLDNLLTYWPVIVGEKLLLIFSQNLLF